jgi:hypothetical protein
VVVFSQVQLKTVAVLGGVGAVSTAILVNICVGFHVGIQHGLINTRVIALVALEGLGSKMIAEVIL